MSEFRFNVSQLLQEPVGATRRYELDDDHLDLEEGLQVRPVQGHVRLTRTQNGVLADAMREYALLEVPMLPLCKPDCKGLCPECGTNLNDETCDCQIDQDDERLAVLKQLLDQSE